MQELQLPKGVDQNSNAREVLRVWAEPGKPQGFTIDGTVWKDPATWGLLLADVAKIRCSNVLRRKRLDEQAALARILAGLKIEVQ
jgi:hypothetical protein